NSLTASAGQSRDGLPSPYPGYGRPHGLVTIRQAVSRCKGSRSWNLPNLPFALAQDAAHQAGPVQRGRPFPGAGLGGPGNQCGLLPSEQPAWLRLDAGQHVALDRTPCSGAGDSTATTWATRSETATSAPGR